MTESAGGPLAHVPTAWSGGKRKNEQDTFGCEARTLRPAGRPIDGPVRNDS